MTPLLKLSFEKMRDDLLKVQDEPSQYLTCWDNPRLAQLFPELGYAAACKVIEEGHPPDDFDSISKLHAYYDKLEHDHRKMFVDDRSNPVLDDPYLLMQDVFPSQHPIPYIARQIPDEDKKLYFVFKEALAQASEQVMVSSMADYQKNWDELTSGMFKYVNFDNIFIAGGAVVAALQPSVKKATDENYFNSDIDVFFYGLKIEEVKDKVVEVYAAIRKAVTNNPDYSIESEPLEEPRWQGSVEESDTLLVRNLRSLVLVGEFPQRQIQIVFRLYKSPAEVLMGPKLKIPRFDIDSCCFGYNGKRVFALPRALRAMTYRYNLVDMTRRSASYELRLFKYAKRGFAVACPNVDPSKLKQVGMINSGNGLAKLLSLEAQMLLPKYHKRKFAKSKIKLDRAEIIQADRQIERIEVEDEESADEFSHYQVIKVPYGKEWNLDRIEKHLNSFLGQVYGAFLYGPFMDIVDYEDDELREQQQSPIILRRSKILSCLERLIPNYLSGEVTMMTFQECWMTENPGKQLLTGSFEPVETTWDQWVSDAYTSDLPKYRRHFYTNYGNAESGDDDYDYDDDDEEEDEEDEDE
ncbi:Protein mono-ADP-ribosyltransferase parp4 [Phlyctochytrium planicorne]|nr:Protein mono-ADP-ribosyltransferase parp4 [Phlyctochytrium planicorne]